MSPPRFVCVFVRVVHPTRHCCITRVSRGSKVEVPPQSFLPHEYGDLALLSALTANQPDITQRPLQCHHTNIIESALRVSKAIFIYIYLYWASARTHTHIHTPARWTSFSQILRLSSSTPSYVSPLMFLLWHFKWVDYWVSGFHQSFSQFLMLHQTPAEQILNKQHTIPYFCS